MNSENPIDRSRKIAFLNCPICGSIRKEDSDDLYKCLNCNSLFKLDISLETQLISSGIKLNFINLALGIVQILALAYLGYLFYVRQHSIYFIGIICLVYPLVLLFRTVMYEFFQNEKPEYSSISSIYVSILNGKILNYDLGSKIFALSIMICFLAGVCGLLFGLLL